jgi:hypothetical protein
MKCCTACRIEKPHSDFHTRKTGRPYSECKACSNARAAEWQRNNKEKARAAKHRSLEMHREKHREDAARKRKESPEKARSYVTKWREQNREKHRAAVARYRANNPEKARELEAKRRAAKKMAMPAWADRKAILAIYKAARALKRHVDHIVPLDSPIVCGLHVECNLQILIPFDNLSKGNRFWPDMPAPV